MSNNFEMMGASDIKKLGNKNPSALFIFAELTKISNHLKGVSWFNVENKPLANLLSYSESTIKRGLKDLCEYGAIEIKGGNRNRKISITRRKKQPYGKMCRNTFEFFKPKPKLGCIYAFMCHLDNNEQGLNKSNRQIAKELGIGESTFRKHINELKKLGFIDQVEGYFKIKKSLPEMIKGSRSAFKGSELARLGVITEQGTYIYNTSNTDNTIGDEKISSLSTEDNQMELKNNWKEKLEKNIVEVVEKNNAVREENFKKRAANMVKKKLEPKQQTTKKKSSSKKMLLNKFVDAFEIAYPNSTRPPIIEMLTSGKSIGQIQGMLDILLAAEIQKGKDDVQAYDDALQEWENFIEFLFEKTNVLESKFKIRFLTLSTLRATFIKLYLFYQESLPTHKKLNKEEAKKRVKKLMFSLEGLKNLKSEAGYKKEMAELQKQLEELG